MTPVTYSLGPKFELRNSWIRSTSAEHAATCFSSRTEFGNSSQIAQDHSFQYAESREVVCDCIVANRGIFFTPNIMHKCCRPMIQGYQILRPPHSVDSRDSAVGIAAGYGLDDRGVGVPVPVGSKISSSPPRPDRLWGPPGLLSNGCRRLLTRK
jgi:hypothetical protein